MPSIAPIRDRASHALSHAKEWAAANRRQAVALGIIVGGGMFCAVSLWTYLTNEVVEEITHVSLNDALDALAEGDHVEAQRLIRRMEDQGTLAPEEYGGPMYVLGVIRAREAEKEWSGEGQAGKFLIASKYLEESRVRGFPPGKEANALLLLSQCLVRSRQFEEAIPVLEDALKLNKNQAGYIHSLLSEAYAQAARPRLERAMSHNLQALGDSMLSDEARKKARIRQVSLQLRSDDTGQARESYESLDPSLQETGAGKLLLAEMLVQEAISAPDESTRRRILQQANEILRAVQLQSRTDPETLRVAAYLMGEAYSVDQRDVLAAIEQFSRVRKLYGDTEEGAVSALREAELYQRIGRHGVAIQSYLRMLSNIGEASSYRNRWLPLSELRRRLMDAKTEFIDAGKFESALELAHNFAGVFGEPEALRIIATIETQWARALLAKVNSAPGHERSVLEKAGRLHHRKAGVLQERLAGIQFASPGYAEALWDAAGSYEEGQSFTKAIEMLNEYVEADISDRRPQALVMLGRMYLAIEQPESALLNLNECIELFDNDASVYEARMLAAQALVGLGRIDQAKQKLDENLHSDGLTPKGLEWQESLFQYGFLLYDNDEFQEAIMALEEAIIRYPQASQAVLGQYLAGNAYRLAAQEPLSHLKTAQSESERQDIIAESEALLSNALAHFTQLQQRLTRDSAHAPLTQLQSVILRNCYMFRGSIFVQLGQYAEALEVYRNASSNYQNQPLVLEAHIQMAFCHLHLGEKSEAKAVVEQAKLVLARLPADADFLMATNLTRDDWQRLLDDIAGLTAT